VQLSLTFSSSSVVDCGEIGVIILSEFTSISLR